MSGLIGGGRSDLMSSPPVLIMGTSSGAPQAEAAKRAAAARAQVPLAAGEQRLAILPAVYGIDDLSDTAAGFNTMVLMKVSPVLVKVLADLGKLGLKGRSTYVRRATTAQEQIIRDLSELKDEDVDYFSILIVKNEVPD